jgi:cbb3-type cytochrome oxidase subunit 3
MNSAPQMPKEYFSFVVTEQFEVLVKVHSSIIIVVLFLALIGSLFYWFWGRRRRKNFEIDSAEFGIGDAKITFKPNTLDQQIAYSVWVELSTRKVGLPIEPDDDVISEIYDSWYAFFNVTRELIKDIPVSKVRTASTSKIIDLSIEILNEGLRPHLTKWQARYRHWYETELSKRKDVEPQEIQKLFPNYSELLADLLAVNSRLVAYRMTLREIVRH